MKIRRLLITIILLICSSIVSISSVFSANQQNDQRFSLRTGSFVHHLYPKNENYTQYFDNNFFSIGVKIDNSNKFVAGTLNNSFGDRCALLGIEKNWKDFNNKFSFRGLYAYSGEFFFKSFDRCGNQGVYKSFKNITSVGFAPYLYHGITYNITDIVNLDFGIILPGIFVSTIGWKF